MAANSKPGLQLGLRIPSEPYQGGDAGSEETVKVTCAVCSKILKVPKWYAERGVKLYFCSPKCSEEWRRKAYPSDEELIKLDGRPEFKGANWPLQSQKARERDSFTCQECGVTESNLGRQLDVHHIISFRFFKSSLEANQLNNLITLCHSCHMKLEAKNKDSMPLFSTPTPEPRNSDESAEDKK